MNIVRLVMAALLLAGCGVAPAPSATPSGELPAEAPEFPGSVGALPWRASGEVPSELREGHVAFPDVEELQRAITSYLDTVSGDARVRVGLLAPMSESEASAYGFVWDIGDDSIAGDEYRFTLRRSVDGWFVAELEQRTHCLRGVSEGLCV